MLHALNAARSAEDVHTWQAHHKAYFSLLRQLLTYEADSIVTAWHLWEVR